MKPQNTNLEAHEVDGSPVQPAPRGPRKLIAAVVAAVAALLVGVVGLEVFAAPAEAADAVIIDVRTAEEFAAGHIEGAINIPLNATDFKEQIASLDRDGEFVVHCGTGARADRVTEYMAEQGFSGIAGSLSLEEAVAFSGSRVIGDLDLADAVNPTKNEGVETADGPPTCALTGESLFGVTRDAD